MASNSFLTNGQSQYNKISRRYLNSTYLRIFPPTQIIRKILKIVGNTGAGCRIFLRSKNFFKKEYEYFFKKNLIIKFED